MNGIPNSFERHGLLCYPHPAEAHAYYYVPLRARLQQNAHGQPMFTLLALGAAGYLMFTGLWSAGDEAVESLRRELAERNAVVDSATIKLWFAPVKGVGCRVLLGDGAGQFHVIGASSTSGMPPYAAVFSIPLTGEQLARATLAGGGRAGFLSIEYDAAIVTPITATGTLVPQSDEVFPWLRQHRFAGITGFRGALEAAIDEGLAAVQVSVPEDPTGRLVSLLYDRVVTRATEVLPHWLDEENGSSADFEISVSMVEEVNVPVRTTTDLAGILHNNSPLSIGTEHVAN